jgi:F-type H+-transporting ATPase subunit alpha
MPVEVQVMVLWAGQNGFVDSVPVDKVKDFQAKLTDYMTSRKVDLMARIAREKALNDTLVNDLKTAVTEFKQMYH